MVEEKRKTPVKIIFLEWIQILLQLFKIQFNSLSLIQKQKKILETKRNLFLKKKNNISRINGEKKKENFKKNKKNFKKVKIKYKKNQKLFPNIWNNLNLDSNIQTPGNFLLKPKKNLTILSMM
jgi:thymidylate kinase